MIMEEYLQVYVEAISKMPFVLSVVPKARSRRVEFLPRQGCFDFTSLNMNGFWFLRPLLDIFLSQAISERGMQQTPVRLFGIVGDVQALMSATSADSAATGMRYPLPAIVF
ncbi:MAG: hypothetical protein ACYDCJ_10080 [Gammaproteobacteria bacterium]